MLWINLLVGLLTGAFAISDLRRVMEFVAESGVSSWEMKK